MRPLSPTRSKKKPGVMEKMLLVNASLSSIVLFFFYICRVERSQALRSVEKISNKVYKLNQYYVKSK